MRLVQATIERALKLKIFFAIQTSQIQAGLGSLLTNYRGPFRNPAVSASPSHSARLPSQTPA